MDERKEKHQGASSGRPRDCEECRLTGTALCGGIATYAWLQRFQLKPHEMHNKRWLGIFAGCWLAAGIWRYNYTPGASNGAIATPDKSGERGHR